VPLWSGRPTALRTQGVCAYESIVVVRAFLIGCAVFLIAGASEVQAQASNNEEARCEGTRKINVNLPARFTSNDLPGCPQGGLLKGTDKPDLMAGEKGDDEVRGLGGSDDLNGGPGSDIVYGGDGDDYVGGGKGEDVIYGGDGNDNLGDLDGQRDKLYCGKGKDRYYADKNDYVDSSCEKKLKPRPAPMA
jgi:RTX calcium-binding nonapeptide repeat (4 copies)